MTIDRYSPLPAVPKFDPVEMIANMFNISDLPVDYQQSKVIYMMPINFTHEAKLAFRTLLKSMPVAVTFRKVNGDHRYMRCTLDSTFIPPSPPKKDETYDLNPFADEDKNLNSTACRVWDIDAKGWRSFRWTSVISFETIKG